MLYSVPTYYFSNLGSYDGVTVSPFPMQLCVSKKIDHNRECKKDNPKRDPKKGGAWFLAQCGGECYVVLSTLVPTFIFRSFKQSIC